jgi:hypothetical protein
LFGAAAIQALLGLLLWGIYGPEFTPADWVYSFSFVIFVLLGILARRARIAAAVTAGALYGTFLLLQAASGMEFLKSGIKFKIPIVVLLLIALVVAFKRKRGTEQGTEPCQPADPAGG